VADGDREHVGPVRLVGHVGIGLAQNVAQDRGPTMVVDRTSPTYPLLSSSWTNSIARAWRACKPTTVRTPCSAASAAIARASSRSRPSGHSQ
jgi:hypothetical protein